MSSKFDQIYNSVLGENVTPAQSVNPNITKDVQDFLNKHKDNPQFFSELEKHIGLLQKTVQQQKPVQQPPQNQQNQNQNQSQNQQNQSQNQQNQNQNQQNQNQNQQNQNQNQQQK